MKYRKLRIAWSVAWGVVAVLLCVLWVRSYWWMEEFRYVRSPTRIVNFVSCEGIFILSNHPWELTGKPYSFFRSYWKPKISHDSNSILGFHYSRNVNYTTATIPYWFVASLPAVVAAAPWLRWRFGLRAMLVVTTLVAFGLGLLVWSMR